MPQPKHTPELGEIQETLLIPLYARAVETRKRRGILHDPRAVEMVDSLEYDFSRFDGARSLVGANLRTLLFDHWVRQFLTAHPSGTVVEIGTGLNTRFERLDNGKVHWFDLDLPDVAALRHRYFDDTPRRHILPASVTDPSWTEAVRNSPGPHFLVAEAVLIYLDEPGVRAVLDLIATQLPGSRLAFETAASHMLDHQNTHDVLAKVSARMSWRCDDPTLIEHWRPGLHLTNSCTFANLPDPVRRELPLSYRTLLRAMSTVRRRDIEAYRFNVFRFD
ncbi:class I SAM-dependent methyltransferase [Streptomyces sp. V2]|uniref:class I SAM-dependent methyltransferase n=1 Tax=Streptomyces sp. V2 TaxID=1424099 RepID=UPI000D66AF6C|nr:class I SAM-dependent methyltransferase [Streptomyces sp. V2]PWG07165.1 class I SAM-dependent methyltransferase [Streptomyces sp. V2]